jgi:predicted dienelactone hydrolase
MAQLTVYYEDLRSDFSEDRFPDRISDFKPEIQELIKQTWISGSNVTFKANDKLDTYRVIRQPISFQTA